MRTETIRHGTKEKVLAWIPVIGYCLLIFIQSSLPSSSLVPSFFGADKLMHFGAYGVLGMLFLRGFRLSNSQMEPFRILLLSIFLTAFYGISDEVHQGFVAVRTADIWDVAADTVGGGFGAWIYYHVNHVALDQRVAENRP